jgi:hypothetical protein
LFFFFTPGHNWIARRQREDCGQWWRTEYWSPGWLLNVFKTGNIKKHC